MSTCQLLRVLQQVAADDVTDSDAHADVGAARPATDAYKIR